MITTIQIPIQKIFNGWSILLFIFSLNSIERGGICRGGGEDKREKWEERVERESESVGRGSERVERESENQV